MPYSNPTVFHDQSPWNSHALPHTAATITAAAQGTSDRLGSNHGGNSSRANRPAAHDRGSSASAGQGRTTSRVTTTIAARATAAKMPTPTSDTEGATAGASTGGSAGSTRAGHARRTRAGAHAGAAGLGISLRSRRAVRQAGRR